MSKTLGQIGYEAYAKSTSNKTFDNREMPTWQQIKEREGDTPRVTKAWEDAAKEICAHYTNTRPIQVGDMIEVFQATVTPWTKSSDIGIRAKVTAIKKEMGFYTTNKRKGLLVDIVETEENVFALCDVRRVKLHETKE